MNIEILISTMNLENHEDLVNNLKVKKSLVINQTNTMQIKDIDYGDKRLYSFNEKGLSKSRNRALDNAIGDICVLADDDLEYEENYEKTINDGYIKYPDADIIAFYVDNYDSNKKRPKRKEGKINFLKSLQIQSVQVTFKRKSIKDKKIRFNENFGAGTKFYMGEENIFLAECLKKGLKIYYVPKTIATLKDNNSSWFKGFDENYFNVRGAVFYAMSKTWYKLLIIQFAIRKRKRFIDNKISTLKAIEYMLNGVKIYKRECL